MSRIHRTPPKLAEWLIARSIPRSDREPMSADLAELFVHRSAEHGVTRLGSGTGRWC